MTWIFCVCLKSVMSYEERTQDSELPPVLCLKRFFPSLFKTMLPSFIIGYVLYIVYRGCSQIFRRFQGCFVGTSYYFF